MDDGDDSDGEEAERRKIVGLCRGVDCKYKTLNIVLGIFTCTCTLVIMRCQEVSLTLYIIFSHWATLLLPLTGWRIMMSCGRIYCGEGSFFILYKSNLHLMVC